MKPWHRRGDFDSYAAEVIAQVAGHKGPLSIEYASTLTRSMLSTIRAVAARICRRYERASVGRRK